MVIYGHSNTVSETIVPVSSDKVTNVQNPQGKPAELLQNSSVNITPTSKTEIGFLQLQPNLSVQATFLLPDAHEKVQSFNNDRKTLTHEQQFITNDQVTEMKYVHGNNHLNEKEILRFHDYENFKQYFKNTNHTFQTLVAVINDEQTLDAPNDITPDPRLNITVLSFKTPGLKFDYKSKLPLDKKLLNPFKELTKGKLTLQLEPISNNKYVPTLTIDYGVNNDAAAKIDLCHNSKFDPTASSLQIASEPILQCNMIIKAEQKLNIAGSKNNLILGLALASDQPKNLRAVHRFMTTYTQVKNNHYFSDHNKFIRFSVPVIATKLQYIMQRMMLSIQVGANVNNIFQGKQQLDSTEGIPFKKGLRLHFVTVEAKCETVAVYAKVQCDIEHPHIENHQVVYKIRFWPRQRNRINNPPVTVLGMMLHVRNVHPKMLFNLKLEYDIESYLSGAYAVVHPQTNSNFLDCIYISFELVLLKHISICIKVSSYSISIAIQGCAPVVSVKDIYQITQRTLSKRTVILQQAVQTTQKPTLPAASFKLPTVQSLSGI